MVRREPSLSLGRGLISGIIAFASTSALTSMWQQFRFSTLLVAAAMVTAGVCLWRGYRWARWFFAIGAVAGSGLLMAVLFMLVADDEFAVSWLGVAGTLGFTAISAFGYVYLLFINRSARAWLSFQRLLHHDDSKRLALKVVGRGPRTRGQTLEAGEEFRAHARALSAEAAVQRRLCAKLLEELRQRQITEPVSVIGIVLHAAALAVIATSFLPLQPIIHLGWWEFAGARGLLGLSVVPAVVLITAVAGHLVWMMSRRRHWTRESFWKPAGIIVPTTLALLLAGFSSSDRTMAVDHLRRELSQEFHIEVTTVTNAWGDELQVVDVERIAETWEGLDEAAAIVSDVRWDRGVRVRLRWRVADDDWVWWTEYIPEVHFFDLPLFQTPTPTGRFAGQDGRHYRHVVTCDWDNDSWPDCDDVDRSAVIEEAISGWWAENGPESPQE